MKVVVDTNVLVSALLNPIGAPAQVVDRAIRGELTVVFDDRVLAEYVEVLSRRKFAFDRTDVFRVLLRLMIGGLRVVPAATKFQLPDPDDRPFVEVAITVDAVLVTGNAKHFPATLPIRVLSPRELLVELGAPQVVVTPMPYNIEQRFDGDWARIDDGSMLTASVPQWEEFCAKNGFELVLRRLPKEPWDPYENARASFEEMCAALEAPAPVDRRPLGDADRLADDLELTIMWAFPIPRRFSGLKGLLRLLHSIAQTRGCSDEVTAIAIASALSRVVALGGDTVEKWDVCSICGRQFRHRRFRKALVARMIRNGYGAVCDTCRRAARRHTRGPK